MAITRWDLIARELVALHRQVEAHVEQAVSLINEAELAERLARQGLGNHLEVEALRRSAVWQHSALREIRASIRQLRGSVRALPPAHPRRSPTRRDC